jgi:hypothetical protein
VKLVHSLKDFHVVRSEAPNVTRCGCTCNSVGVVCNTSAILPRSSRTFGAALARGCFEGDLAIITRRDPEWVRIR